MPILMSSKTSHRNKVPWNIPCARLEGGIYTNPDDKPMHPVQAGPPLEGVGDFKPQVYCDVDMGTVIGLVDFGAKTGA
jgi:hypothetical protein